MLERDERKRNKLQGRYTAATALEVRAPPDHPSGEEQARRRTRQLLQASSCSCFHTLLCLGLSSAAILFMLFSILHLTVWYLSSYRITGSLVAPSQCSAAARGILGSTQACEAFNAVAPLRCFYVSRLPAHLACPVYCSLHALFRRKLCRPLVYLCVMTSATFTVAACSCTVKF